MTGEIIKIDPQMKRHLVDRARWAKDNAYCPYSEFPVGAALYANGHVFDGCNIEVGGRIGSIHAEMLCIYKAVMSGKMRLDAIAVSCSDGTGDVMCSMCQHVAAEFVDDMLILSDTGDDWDEHSLKGELGDAFRPGDSR